MRIILAIGIGSFFGGILRYLCSGAVQARFFSSFPYGTLVVNILGCFAIGMVFALSNRGNLSPEWRLFLATGVLGGFTTYSAFSNETFGMIRDGQFLPALLYVGASIFLGLFATFLGYSAIKIAG
jgi:CrcB protein